MKLSISNIAWTAENDDIMYQYLREQKFNGLEIAPTRIFSERPYEHIQEAKMFAETLKENYGLSISSMQSIWFGRTEKIFSSREEREILIIHTKKAIDFANKIGCKNLVFGCPKNRNINSEDQYDIAIEFFSILGEYAQSKHTILSIEPNPTIYNTNFINTTEQAFQLVKDINNTGVMVNVDFGTIIQNEEELETIIENIDLVNHIHISEPFLEKIMEREAHKRLAEALIIKNYKKYVSIEMKNSEDLSGVKETIHYVRGVFA